MNVLAIDTSTVRGSVAVLCDEKVQLDESFIADRHHSALLFPVLERARDCVARFDRIVVGIGPGSYAGIRIAIAAAIGLRIRWQAKLVGIPSVTALAPGVDEYLAIGDARRGTFHFTHLRGNVAIEGPLLVSESELRARFALHHACPIFSSERLEQFGHVIEAFPRAALLGLLALKEIGIVAEDDLEPLYLREPHITQPRNAPR